MLRAMGSQAAVIQQGVTRMRSMNLPVTCSVRNWTELKQLMQEEVYNVHETSKDG